RGGRAGGRRDGHAMTPRALRWIAAASLIAGAGCQRAAETESAQAATATAAKTPDPSTDTVYRCPMDKDIRAHAPGKCPRCGMALVTSIPEPAEYHLDVTASPAPAPGSPVRLTFDVTDPWKGNPVTKYSVVHEKLFHAFIVSEDLDFFRHVHPEWHDDVRAFTYDVTLPKA